MSERFNVAKAQTQIAELQQKIADQEEHERQIGPENTAVERYHDMVEYDSDPYGGWSFTTDADFDNKHSSRWITKFKYRTHKEATEAVLGHEIDHDTFLAIVDAVTSTEYERGAYKR